ncbi:alpha-amylase [Chitinimonas arctica]|uniref:Alpha-amylase n=2 Tax=Chitinimonas arctica TaxID=2594795 RepID=A0A516SMS4_9NEIS|nr:alpha-amylase [Chitinimonas arctica]
MPRPAVAPAAPIAAETSPVAGMAANPIVYFVLTDRFLNGNPANDRSYGRSPDGDKEIGSFHGGDLAGLTRRLKEGYFQRLGVNALWISAPYEQIHGWVQGGKAEFKHYGYHGYFALDYTVLDRNMGTAEELREMVDTAHAQGIRVLFDVVMNHPGYLDIETATQLSIPVLWPEAAQKYTLSDYHGWIDYNADKQRWAQWWGGDWVRAGLAGYREGGSDDFSKQLAFLPDFRTDNAQPVGLPPFLAGKSDSRAKPLPNATVREYLVSWLSDWVREYGIDGFRCDTAKHVEPASWQALKTASNAALADWKARHPRKKVDDAPFWMVGEVFPHGVERDDYYQQGFDSLINFDLQDRKLDEPAELDRLYSEYALALAAGRAGGRTFDVLSYLSSHDTRLYRRDRLMQAGSALLLAPGGVQIFYGDESARPAGPASAGDPQQATRSDMNWASPDLAVLAHWQKLGSFRARHVALARGSHQRLSQMPYSFARVLGQDRVVAAPFATGAVEIPVQDVFRDGEKLRDAYSGASVTVIAGRVKLQAAGTVLLEAMD